MSLSSDQDSHSLGQSCFELFVQLVYADTVDEVMDALVVWLAPEDNGDVEGDEDVVVGWAGAHWEFVGDVLLGHEELNFGPGQAEDEAAVLLDVIELSVLRYDGEGAFRSGAK